MSTVMDIWAVSSTCLLRIVLLTFLFMSFVPYIDISSVKCIPNCEISWLLVE